MRGNAWVVELAKEAEELGISVDIDGRKYDYADTERVSKVLQRKSYMIDFEGNALGEVVALHFDSVEPCQKPSYKTLRFCEKNKK